MGGGGGKSSGSSKPVKVPLSGEEEQLQAMNLQVAQNIMDAIRAQSQFQTQQFASLGPVFEGMGAEQAAWNAALSPEQRVAMLQSDLARGERGAQIGDQLRDLELERIRSGVATPEQRSALNELFAARLGIGESDINRITGEGLQQLRGELAPSLGLRSTDTPIMDRGGNIVSEGIRQKSQLARQLAGEQAQAEIAMPFQTAPLAQYQQQLLNAQGEFQKGLQQAAFTNRMALASQVGQQGLGLAGMGGTLAGLQESFKPTVGTKSKQKSISVNASMSSRRLKTNNEAVDHEAILVALESLPVEKWTYTFEDGEHIGPYAEDFLAAFGIGDDKQINYTDAIGVLMAAVKALSRRVRELEV
jgi:hypothetical protein